MIAISLIYFPLWFSAGLDTKVLLGPCKKLDSQIQQCRDRWQHYLVLRRFILKLLVMLMSPHEIECPHEFQHALSIAKRRPAFTGSGRWRYRIKGKNFHRALRGHSIPRISSGWITCTGRNLWHEIYPVDTNPKGQEGQKG